MIWSGTTRTSAGATESATAFLRGAAAPGIAIINSIANLGGFVIPFAVGAIKDATGSTANGMYFLAAVLFGGAVLGVAVRFTD